LTRSPAPRAATIALAFVCLALVAGTCSESAAKPSPTATVRALPAPVTIQQEPQGVELADPAFTALPGAKADYGRLGGTVYRIEMPDDWNGRLFMYQHGFQSLAPKAEVNNPRLRSYLIAHGWAWAASSFGSTSLIPGRAADETAALWDFFVSKYGRPVFSYVGGDSMGGAATNIAAERYGDRYDGALSMCGFAGQTAQTDIVDDYFFAAAYAAGVTQAEFDASSDYPKLIDERIIPAMRDSTARKTFEDIAIGLTGGPRPFDRLGLHLEEKTNWFRSGILIATRVGGNADREYQLAPGSLVSSADLNRGVIRMNADESRRASFNDGNEISGDLQMPMLTLHTTGDWQVPIDQEQILYRKVSAAGKSERLVQRYIAAPEHCGFTDLEVETGLQDLVAWVEHGTKPRGDDVSYPDLARAGGQFTLSQRFGSDVASAAPGAADRVTMSGSLSIDGAPVPDGAFTWVEVQRDGLTAVCSFRGEPIADGRYDVTVAADSEVHGCGAPGATLSLVTFAGGDLVRSPSVAWPGGGSRSIAVDLDAHPEAAGDGSHRITPIFGKVSDAAGNRLPQGTIVEAFAGTTLCGRGVVPPVVMQFSDPDGFALTAAGPAAIPGCGENATLSFAVNGAPVAETAVNDLQLREHHLDLVAPD
jgi:hypothetical protein